MRYLVQVISLIILSAGLCAGQSIQITGPAKSVMTEGRAYTINWVGSGIKSVSVIASGKRTPRGIRSRGTFTISVANAVSAGTGALSWKVPWVDAIGFTLKLKGFDPAGRLVVTAARNFGFRPAVMANRTADGIYLALQKPYNQRLYVQKNQRITRAYISSSSENYLWLPTSSNPPKPHDHAGVFHVIDKTPMHYSKLFDVPMRYAMQYFRGHFIHATSPNLYHNLGEPASGGCNRLTLHDARELFSTTPVGTRVEVIGPKV